MKSRDVVILCFSIAIVSGYVYGIDLPQALEHPLRDSPYNLSTLSFNLLYVIMFLPIFLFDMPLGNLIDRLPLPRTLLTLLLFQTLAQFLQAAMFQSRPHGYFTVVLLCRFIFGIVGEGIYIVQGIVLERHCGGNYEFLVSLARGLSYLFDSMSSLLTTTLYDHTQSLSFPIYIATIVSLFSTICGIGLICYIKSISKQQQLKQKQKLIAINDGLCGQQEDNGVQQQTKTLTETETEIAVTMNINGQTNGETDSLGNQKRSIVEDLKGTQWTLWMIITGVMLIEASATSNIDNLNDLLINRFGFTYLQAGKLAMISNGGVLLFSIISGKFITHCPHHRRTLYFLSTAQFFLISICFYFLPNATLPSAIHYTITILFLTSISSSLGIFYSVIFTCIPFCAEQRVMGTAWGLGGMAMGFSACIMPLIFSAVMKENLGEGYLNVSFVGVIASFLTVLHAIYLYFGAFGILSVRYERIVEMKKQGNTLTQIIHILRNQ